MAKANLGKVDRVLRFALAFWWLGPWAPEFKSEAANVIVMVIGWIALVESFVAWCWLHDVFHIDNKD